MSWFCYIYILLLLGQRIPFVIPRTLLNRGSLNQGSSVERTCVGLEVTRLECDHSFSITLFVSDNGISFIFHARL